MVTLLQLITQLHHLSGTGLLQNISDAQTRWSDNMSETTWWVVRDRALLRGQR